MEFLQHLAEQTTMPFLTAFLLGLMMSISPCPMISNITAIGFISKEISIRQSVFTNGLFYILGRAFAFTSLGLFIFFGASKFHIARFFQSYGEKFIGPLLIMVGIIMLDLFKFKLPAFHTLADKAGKQSSLKWRAFLLGAALALAFCPASAMLYFGVLMPLTISSASGLYLPFVFAISSSIPVLIFAWLIAYSLSGIGNVYNKIQRFEKWFRYIVAIVFINAGLYYIYLIYFK